MSTATKADLLELSRKDGYTIVRILLSNISSDEEVNGLYWRIKELLDQTENKLIINLSSVRYMTSGMIGKIVLLNKVSHGKKEKLWLCDMHPTIYDVFRFTRLHRTLNIAQNVEEALTGTRQLN